MKEGERERLAALDPRVRWWWAVVVVVGGGGQLKGPGRRSKAACLELKRARFSYRSGDSLLLLQRLREVECVSNSPIPPPSHPPPLPLFLLVFNNGRVRVSACPAVLVTQSHQRLEMSK